MKAFLRSMNKEIILLNRYRESRGKILFSAYTLPDCQYVNGHDAMNAFIWKPNQTQPTIPDNFGIQSI